MIAQLLAVLAALTLALPALGAEGAPAPAPKLDASFLPQQPELLTYRTTAGGKPGFFTVALTRSGKELEVLVNMIEPGFSKTVWGTLGEDLRPLRSQAIIAIGDHVVRTACQTLSRWATLPSCRHLTLSVNVSPRQFTEPTFVPHLIAALQEQPLLRELAATPLYGALLLRVALTPGA